MPKHFIITVIDETLPRIPKFKKLIYCPEKEWNVQTNEAVVKIGIANTLFHRTTFEPVSMADSVTHSSKIDFTPETKISFDAALENADFLHAIMILGSLQETYIQEHNKINLTIEKTCEILNLYQSKPSAMGSSMAHKEADVNELTNHSTVRP